MKLAETIEHSLHVYVESGALAGATALTWRDGEPLEVACVGWRDLEHKTPLQRDSLFRIASMTKPITSVVALMLHEEGQFELNESIVRWAPEFAKMRVLRSATGPLDDTCEALRQITFEDLLTHRSGLTYGFSHPGPLAQTYAAALGGAIDTHVSPDDWIARLAALPLVIQPGAMFNYGHSTDLLGLLIARIENAPLEDVLQQRIFTPLGMADTSFSVVPQKATRCSRLHGFDECGRLATRTTCPGGSTLPERPADMSFMSGGQGLWSTVEDYLSFARMFVSEGMVDGVRLLHPQTLALMASNHLTSTQRAHSQILGTALFRHGHGFGLGVAVVLDPANAEPTLCQGGVGTVGWPGGFGGWWQADPCRKSVQIFLSHNIVEPEQLARGIGHAVYAAIADFHALTNAPPAAGVPMRGTTS